ncbi:hypothetical protein B0H12DRAFT_1069894 [Mycena haematopus]|nr:hypothetical protein B0H12DRAFT_1069894 [Mycena haematopus]
MLTVGRAAKVSRGNLQESRLPRSTAAGRRRSAALYMAPLGLSIVGLSTSTAYRSSIVGNRLATITANDANDGCSPVFSKVVVFLLPFRTIKLALGSKKELDGYISTHVKQRLYAILREIYASSTRFYQGSLVDPPLYTVPTRRGVPTGLQLYWRLTRPM